MSALRRADLPDLELVRDLSDAQLKQLSEYAHLLRGFNRQLNLVSRESVGEIESVHIPHVLALLMRPFVAGASVVDFGTGGGFPAIPLAIARPDLRVVAIDSVEKKVLAVRTMARRLGLQNVETWCGDAAVWDGTAAYAVSRAVAPIATLWLWTGRVLDRVDAPIDAWRPGLLCLKGGELAGELDALNRESSAGRRAAPQVEIHGMSQHFVNPYFQGKLVVHVYE